MLRQHLGMAVVLSLMLAAEGFAQGETALPFLLISPSAEANGMGETSVASLTDDPVALMANPAHLGMQSAHHYLSIGYNRSDWLPAFNQSDLWYRAYALTTSINLKKVFGIEPEISLGVGYSQVFLNLGEFAVTQGDPVPVSTFTAYEESNQYTLAAGINYWIKASAGITFKRIASNLAPFDVQGQGLGGATVDTYDYGLLFGVPVVGIISRLSGEEFALLPAFSPFADLGFGLARNNLGDNTVVYLTDLGDPLPRYARIGIDCDLGFVYRRADIDWRTLSFRWTREANDLLVRRSVTPAGASWEYRGGFGDIDFFSEVIAGNTNSETIRKTGWEFNFLELLTVRGGRFEEDPERGNRRYNSYGFGVRSSGITKFLRAIDAPLARSDIVGFLVSHLDLRYDHSHWSTDAANHPLSNTKFDSFHIFLTN